MRRFFQDLLRRRSGSYRVLVFEEDSREDPREYRLRPGRLRWVLAGSLLFVVALTTATVALTPIADWIRGRDVEALRQQAQSQARRVAALADSVELQQQYGRQLGALMTGAVDSLEVAAAEENGASGAPVTGAPEFEGSEPHGAAVTAEVPTRTVDAGSESRTGSSVGTVSWPVMPPAEGFITRGFNADLRHYAVDVATEKGSQVRSMARGFVVFADWTQAGGLAVAVQHPGGYLSIYKHNSRLLKEVGDPVEGGEAVAVSGNTGHVTTGPHVHVELWRDGLAQDPRRYVLGW